MNKKINLMLTCMCISANITFAESTFKEAFSQGNVSGDITAYAIGTNNKGSNDTGFSAGTVGLSYETKSYYDFGAKFSFRGNHTFSEKNDGDANSFQNDAIMSEVFIKYEKENIGFFIGRQSIDLEWLGDYNEAAVLSLNLPYETVTTLGYTQRKAEIDEDTSEDFYKPTKDGAYVIDVKNNTLKNLEINPYFYDAIDVASFYGLKGVFGSEYFGAIAHYAQSSEDVNNTADGSILNLEINTSIKDFYASFGYIQTDKDGGIGSMDAYGDNINLMDSGNQIYTTDASTYYATTSYSFKDLNLGVLYSDTEYGKNNFDESELNITADYSFTDELSVSFLYANIDGETSADSSDYASVTFVYGF